MRSTSHCTLAFINLLVPLGGDALYFEQWDDIQDDVRGRLTQHIGGKSQSSFERAVQ